MDENIEKLLNTNVDAIAESSKKKKTGIIVGVVITFILVALIVVYITVISPSMKYKHAQELLDVGQFEEAVTAFTELGDYKDSSDKAIESTYHQAKSLYENKDYAKAIEIFNTIPGYEDVSGLIPEVQLAYANDLYEQKKYADALEQFKLCSSVEGVSERLDSIVYDFVANNDYNNALNYSFMHKDDDPYVHEIYYQYLNWQMDNHEYDKTAETFGKIYGYRDTSTNKKFAGAKLLYIGTLRNTIIEGSIFSISSVVISYYVKPETITQNVYGFTSVWGNIKNETNIDHEWKYYFDGNDIYLKGNNDSDFKKVGTIVKFNPAKGDDKPSVTLTMKHNDSMSVTNTKFEYDNKYDELVIKDEKAVTIVEPIKEATSTDNTQKVQSNTNDESKQPDEGHFISLSGYDYKVSVGDTITIKISKPDGIPVYLKPDPIYGTPGSGFSSIRDAQKGEYTFTFNEPYEYDFYFAYTAADNTLVKSKNVHISCTPKEADVSSIDIDKMQHE